MPVMKIRIVRMAVNQRPVAMGMDMRLARRIVLAMGVLVVRIMDVGMRMVERFVDMIMVMPLDQVQPQANPHQHRRYDQSGRDRLAEHRQCEHRSEEHTSELQSLMRISYSVFCLYNNNQIG